MDLESRGKMHGAYHAVLEDRETLATNSTGTNKTLECKWITPAEIMHKKEPKEKDLSEAIEEGRKPLTFLAAALKASLCEMSGLPALMRWISSLQSHSPSPRESQQKKKLKRETSDRCI